MNANVQPITNHVAAAVGRLVEQYRSGPRLAGLVSALCLEVQALENAIYALDAGRQLQNAQGAQLDALGTLVGQPRNGVDDPTYLVLLRGAIAEAFSDGTPETLLGIVRTVFEAAAVFQKTPDSPTEALSPGRANVGYGIGSPATPAAIYPWVQAIVTAALDAGVGLAFLSTFNASGAFSMAGPQKWVGGFSDVNGNGGAPLGGLVYNNPGV